MNFNQFFKTEKEIIDWLDSKFIKNYTIIPDKEYGFVVNVNESVHLDFCDFELFPVKFNTVNGYFLIVNSDLVSLCGSPEYVQTDFTCSNTKINSLKYLPKYIDGDIDISSNELVSLEYAPEIVNGDFNCSHNNLTSLKYCPKIINRAISIVGNKIENYIFFPEKVKNYILTNDIKVYSYDELYPIHLKDKSKYEKDLLNKQVIINNNNKSINKI